MKKGKKKKIGRNDPCPCGSGEKYKKCCLPKEESRKLPKVISRHMIEEESQRIFQSYFNLKNGFVVRELPKDYGIDYIVELLNVNDETTGVSFNVQLKGVANPEYKSDSIAVSLKKSTLNLFSRQLYPTIIIVVDT
jgi:hypothetical protein